MRYGVISDVHGNLPALERTLGLLEREGVEVYACLGDLVGYGPWPNECVERVAELGAVTVAGNHDLMAIARLPVAPAVRATTEWTRAALSPSARTYLEALPATAELAGGVALAHGSLDRPDRYLASPADAASELHRLAHARPQAWLLLVGHTHANLAYGQRRGTLLYLAHGEVPLRGDERFLLNPGSVGQSRERAPVARAMILDVDQRIARFVRTDYDADSVRRELRRHRLPAQAHHARPPAWRSAPLRRARRRLTERGVRAMRPSRDRARDR